MSITLPEALTRCIEHREIFSDEMSILFRKIISGEMSPIMITALIIGLRVKTESIGEITAAAQIMRESTIKIPIIETANLVDIVGTGGDNAHTFNISTAAMFVAAAAGARVAKHGNRSVSSSSGSADIIEAIGANINLQPEQIAQSITQTGIGFIFSPNHHIIMKHVASIRKELQIRTIFNILGPLVNPANAPNILMGVFHPDLVGILIRVLHQLGTQHALVVWGSDNLDEITLGGTTMVGELINGKIHEYKIHPKDFGIKMFSIRNFQATTITESKIKIFEVLQGKPGPAKEIVALNTGAALYTAGIVDSIEEGLIKARNAIDSGAALAKMKQFINVTQRLASSS